MMRFDHNDGSELVDYSNIESYDEFIQKVDKVNKNKLVYCFFVIVFVMPNIE